MIPVFPNDAVREKVVKTIAWLQERFPVTKEQASAAVMYNGCFVADSEYENYLRIECKIEIKQ